MNYATKSNMAAGGPLFCNSKHLSVLLNQFSREIHIGSFLKRVLSTLETPVRVSRLQDGPSLKDFIEKSSPSSNTVVNDVELTSERVPYIGYDVNTGHRRKVYFETYGCQMNVNDTEIARSVLENNGFITCHDIKQIKFYLCHALLNVRMTQVENLAKILPRSLFWQDLGKILPMSQSWQGLGKISCSESCQDLISYLKHINHKRSIVLTGMKKNEQTANAINKESAERKIWGRLDYFKHLRKKREKSLPELKVGVLGCMAERLKKGLLETDKMVDLVAGPDAYRDLPKLLALTESGQTAVNVLLSMDETYADITPVRINKDSPTAYVSIMRGCNNMCTYCIVPFTRGRERSRQSSSIIEEIKHLHEQGVREVTLLGQNVNSYRDLSTSSSWSPNSSTSEGFHTVYKNKDGGLRFAELLDNASQVSSEMRIRFTSPHPKDFPDELLYVIRDNPNVCNYIHLPAQSGNTQVLQTMRRGYTREAYLDLVEHIRNVIPGVSLSSDFIAGFCDETEQAHQDTLSLLKLVKYDMAYMFAYSMRQKTRAYHRLNDNVPAEVKQRRLSEIIETFHKEAEIVKARHVGSKQLVLVEGPSRRSEFDLSGKNDGFTTVSFPNITVPCDVTSSSDVVIKPGDYVEVEITSSSSGSLRGRAVKRSSIQQFHKNMAHR